VPAGAGVGEPFQVAEDGEQQLRVVAEVGAVFGRPEITPLMGEEPQLIEKRVKLPCRRRPASFSIGRSSSSR